MCLSNDIVTGFIFEISSFNSKGSKKGLIYIKGAQFNGALHPGPYLAESSARLIHL